MSEALTAATCGNCKFHATLKEDLTLVECRGVPPTPVAIPHPQGIQIVLQRARLPRIEPGCALHKTIVLLGGLS